MRANRVLRRSAMGLTLVLLVGLIPAMQSIVAASTSRPADSGAAPAYTAEIRPEMELLAGVLAQTSWMQTAGPPAGGDEYFHALKQHFAPFKDHEAVRLAEELTKAGFQFDAPPNYILHLGGLPDLELLYPYGDYLEGRAGGRKGAEVGRDRLERFRLALKDLAAQSEFSDFLAEWEPSFAKWVAEAQFDGDKIIAWLEAFSGTKGAEFHMILAPSMFPGGGYGATIDGADGKKMIYQIVRAGGGTAGPGFPSGQQLEDLALHEWGHAFVNPALEASAPRLKALGYLYRPVASTMRKQAYGTVETFFNEQVLRGVTSLAIEQFHGQDDYEQAITYNEDRKFYLTRDVIAILREYQANRTQYPTFASFAPRLLDELAASHKPTGGVQSTLVIAVTIAVAVLISLAAVRNVRRTGRPAA